MFYRIDMGNLTVTSEAGEQYQGLGGRALSSRIVELEVDPSAHPLGEKNKLVFATSLLSGTGAPNGGRMSLGAKSPLTEGIKESNVGGAMGMKLGRMGIRGIIVEGLPKNAGSYVVKVAASGVTLEEMPQDNK